MRRTPREVQQNRALQQRARELRKRQTPAEHRLWQALRGAQCDGFKFRRQHVVGRFIVDFCCIRARLIVEVDGSVHYNPAQRAGDAYRDDILQNKGFVVLRVSNRDVLNQLDDVLVRIKVMLHRYQGTSD